MSKKARVFIVGLDGATFDLILPWIREGRLPSLSHMMENGVYGELRSTIPILTPVAWSSFMTGKNSGKHGIASFFTREKDSYVVKFTTTKSGDTPRKTPFFLLALNAYPYQECYYRQENCAH